MDTTKAKKALKKIAQREGVSEETVRREIETAIAEAMKSPEPQARAFWESIPHKGEKPTPEEVVAYIADMIRD